MYEGVGHREEFRNHMKQVQI